MEETGMDAERNTSCDTQPTDLCLTSLVRSESFSIIVHPLTNSMVVLTPASNQLTIQVQTSTIPSIVLPFYRLTKSNSRCAVYFSNSNSLVSQIEDDIKVQAFIKRSIVIMARSQCCHKRVSNDYFTTTALQVIERKGKTCEASLEELMNISNAIKPEYLPRSSVGEGSSDVLPLDFDSPTLLTSDNYYVLTRLNREEFHNRCLCPRPVPLRNTQNRTARTTVTCRLMKLILGICNQVLTTLFSFPDRRTVARTIHSACRALVGHCFAIPGFRAYELKKKSLICTHVH